jgi:peroxiredoxin
VSELRGLGEVHKELVDQGGTLLAISVDAVKDNKRVVKNNKLPFPVLSDEQREVVWDYGVIHKGAGMDGSDLPLPSMFLIDCNGIITWRYVAKKVQNRLDPKLVMKVVTPDEK